MMTRETSALSVLMVTTRYFPSMGGLETHVHEAAPSGEERSRCHTANYCSACSSHSASQGGGEEEMPVIRVRVWPPQRDYYLAPEMYTIIEHGGWDLVNCQAYHTFVPPLATFADESR